MQAAAIKAKLYDTAVGLLETNFVGGRRAVRQKLAEILDPDISASNATATHDALLTLAECRERRTRLITTNFDRLFEHVIANGRASAERFEAPLLPVPKQRWDGLVYLHGLLPEDSADKNLDNLVVSSGDFRSVLCSIQVMIDAIADPSGRSLHCVSGEVCVARGRVDRRKQHTLPPIDQPQDTTA